MEPIDYLAEIERVARELDASAAAAGATSRNMRFNPWLHAEPLVALLAVRRGRTLPGMLLACLPRKETAQEINEKFDDVCLWFTTGVIDGLDFSGPKVGNPLSKHKEVIRAARDVWGMFVGKGDPLAVFAKSDARYHAKFLKKEG